MPDGLTRTQEALAAGEASSDADRLRLLEELYESFDADLAASDLFQAASTSAEPHSG